MMLGDAAVTVPRDEWSDCTEEGMPYTLGAFDGCGALQFSLAYYESGKEPHPGDPELLRLLDGWSRREGSPDPVAAPRCFDAGPNRWVTASFRDARERAEIGEDRYWRVWYGSDGLNFAYVTYNCRWSDRDAEQADVDAMIQSFRFHAPGRQWQPRAAVA